MQLANAACIAGRRHTEECVPSLRQPTIKDGAKPSEWPNRKNRPQPLPTRQHPNDFDPCEVTLAPTTIDNAHVHLFRHLFARVRRRALQDFRVVVIQPLDATIAIERLHTRAHPTAQIATAVGVDFDLVSLFHLAKRRAAALVKSNLMAGSSPPLNNDFTLNVLCQPHDTIRLFAYKVDSRGVSEARPSGRATLTTRVWIAEQPLLTRGLLTQ